MTIFGQNRVHELTVLCSFWRGTFLAPKITEKKPVFLGPSRTQKYRVKMHRSSVGNFRSGPDQPKPARPQKKPKKGGPKCHIYILKSTIFVILEGQKPIFDTFENCCSATFWPFLKMAHFSNRLNPTHFPPFPPYTTPGYNEKSGQICYQKLSPKGSQDRYFKKGSK